MRAWRATWVSAAPAIAVAMSLSACGGTARAEATAVSVRDGAFEDATLVVPVGTEVRWTNHGSHRHTVTGVGPATDGAAGPPGEPAEPSWDSGALRPGETFSHRFTEEGLYSYWCTYHRHEEMVGAVRVEAP